MNKQLHIITVGNSIVTNYQRKKNQELGKLASNSPEWKRFLDDRKFLASVSDFVRENPRENSAEINSFQGYIEKKGVKEGACSVYLAGTKTHINEIAVRTLERYFREKGIELFNPGEISGYFWEKEFKADAVSEFQRGISELLDVFLRIASKRKEDGYDVVFNPTGGMKPHVITCALAGFMMGCEIYYIHEEFDKKDLVILPPLLYLPRGKEIELLRELKNRKLLSGSDFEKYRKSNEEEVERLKTYGLIEIETDEKTGRDYRIKLTSKGKFIIGLYE